MNRDQRANIAHALMHLTSNKIADDDYMGDRGWYCGNREQFVKRHKKAIEFLRSLLTNQRRKNLTVSPSHPEP